EKILGTSPERCMGLEVKCTFPPCEDSYCDILGCIETLIVGLTVLLLGSVVAGTATDMGMLIGRGIVQGCGASALVSLVTVVVSDITIERKCGRFTMFSAIWAVCLPSRAAAGHGCAIAGIFIAVFLCLPRPRGSFQEKLWCVNFIGMVVLVTGIVMALLALSFGSKDYAWSSPMVLCLPIFGIAIVGTFVVIEWKIPAEPIMPLRLFKNRNVGLMLVMQLFVGTVIFGPTFYVPMYFSVIHNSSAISAGLHLLPYILPISIFSTISGFVVAKTGRYRELLWVGGSITTVGTGLFVLLDESTSTGKSIGLTIVGGTGMGLLLQPMLLALQTAIQPRDMATGTTLFVAIRTLSSSIGLAVFQTVQQNKPGYIISKLKLQYPQYADLIAKAIYNQAVIRASSMLPKLSQALIDAYVVTLRAVFYASIPFAVMIVIVLAVFVRHILLCTHMEKTLEKQFILRVLPDMAAHFGCLVGERRIQDHLQLSFRDEHNAIVTFDGSRYVARLVNLSTITESYCALDKRQMLKTANICHMLLVERLLAPDEDPALLPLVRGLDVIHLDRLSPALADVCRTHFCHRIPNTKIESIECKVLRLLEEDIQAVAIKLEAIDIEQQPGKDSQGATPSVDLMSPVTIDDLNTPMVADDDGASSFAIDDLEFYENLAAKLEQGLDELNAKWQELEHYARVVADEEH
ncbi:hypothetical protein FBU31_000668, partial [Coemansia sp. 'formosensis']